MHRVRDLSASSIEPSRTHPFSLLCTAGAGAPAATKGVRPSASTPLFPAAASGFDRVFTPAASALALPPSPLPLANRPDVGVLDGERRFDSSPAA